MCFVHQQRQRRRKRERGSGELHQHGRAERQSGQDGIPPSPAARRAQRQPDGDHDQRARLGITKGQPFVKKQIRRHDPQPPGQQRPASPRQALRQRAAGGQPDHTHEQGGDAPGKNRRVLWIQSGYQPVIDDFAIADGPERMAVPDFYRPR